MARRRRRRWWRRLLDKGGFDPTVINGGVIHAYGSNARAGAGEWMVVEADESRRLLQPPARDHCHRDQHRPRTYGALGHLRRAAEGVPRFRVEHPVLRACGLLHRSSRGAGAGRPRDGPPGGDLRLQRAGRCAGAEPDLREWRGAFRHRLAGRGSGDRGLHPADAGGSQRLATPCRPSRWRGIWG